MVSSRSATERIRSGSPEALFAAASRTAASASKVSMNSAVAISFGAIGTMAFAPIIRSGVGAFGSTCFWKFVGSAEIGTGQGAGAAAGSWASLIGRPASLRPGERVEARLAGVLPRQFPDPFVEEEGAGQPGDRRRPPQSERGELGAHAWIVRRELHGLAQGADRVLLVARHHQRARQVHQRLGGLQPAAQRLLAEADAALPISFDQHQRQAVVREDARIVQVAPPGLLEDLVRRAGIEIEQRASFVEDAIDVPAMD